MENFSPSPFKTCRVLGIAALCALWFVLTGWPTASAESPTAACGPCLIVAQNTSQIGTGEYDTQGMTREGIDESGFDQDGIDTQGMDTQGMTREGIDESGFDQSGIDTQGMDSEGMDRSGLTPAPE